MNSLTKVQANGEACEILRQELVSIKTIGERLRSEVYASDKKAHDLQLLLSATQEQFLRVTGQVTEGRSILDSLRKELLILDEDRMSKLQVEQIAERDYRTDSVTMSEMHRELAILSEEKARRSSENVSSEFETFSIKQELESAINELRIKRTQRNDLNAEAANISERISTTDQQLLEMGNLYHATRDRHILKNRVLFELQTNLANLKKELTTVLKKVESTKAEIDGLSSPILEDTRKLANLIHERKSKEQELAREVSESQRLLSIMKTRQAQKSYLEREILELEDKREQLQKRVSLISHSNTSVDKEISETDAILGDLEREIAQVVNEIASRKERILSDTTIIESCRSEIAILEIELKSAETQLESLPSQLQQLRDESVAVDSHLLDLEYQIELEKRKLENGESRIVSESERASILERIKLIEADIQSATNVRNNMQSQISKLRTEMRITEKHRVAINEELNIVKDEVHEIESFVSSLEREEDSVKKSLVHALVFRDKLVADLWDKKKELTDIVSHVYTSQTDLGLLEKVLEDRNRDQLLKMEELKMINKELSRQRHDLRKKVWETQHETELLKSKMSIVKEREERGKVPEEDLGALVTEIEGLKVSIEKARMDLNKIEQVFGTDSSHEERDRKLEELKNERDKLRNELASRGKVLDQNTRRAIAALSYHEWTKCVSETFPSLFDELKKELNSIGMEFP